MQEKGFLPGPKTQEMLQAWVSGKQAKEDKVTDLEPNQLENNSLKNIVKDIPSKFDWEKNFLRQPETRRVDGMRVHSQTSISLRAARFAIHRQPKFCKNDEEIVAVIAHELGHWELNHTVYTFVAMQFGHEQIIVIFEAFEKMVHLGYKTSDENKDSKMESEDVVLVPLLKYLRHLCGSLVKVGLSMRCFGMEWNGVIVSHDLPVSAGSAVSVFVINQTILALSEAGKLYQNYNNWPCLMDFALHIRGRHSESSEPVWVDFTATCPEKNLLIKSGVARVMDRELISNRWINHGQPARANVVAIADAGSRREVVYTISSDGDLYEYDKKSKPSWKRQIWQDKTSQAAPLMPSKGCNLHGLSDDHSESLFLLTKEGTLVERRFHQRKWKWVVHGKPQDQNLTSITPALQDESAETSSTSLFFTTSYGFVFEYQIPKQLGGRLIQSSEEYNYVPDNWISTNFHLRLMDVGKSVFLITDEGLIFEYICIESAWIWLRHESFTPMKGILSNYNGSLFMIDTPGRLLLRERRGMELAWRNCIAMRREQNVNGGQPWDGLPGQEN
ncbi:hypothetical protein VNO80_25992 [Phaseolus coccineus]|uniref:Peptidase M48 domain-containing protein n=1 Tax=Phaseolus coccineus TaxID=3886 RepID=A0AAN9LV67_PHACN